MQHTFVNTNIVISNNDFIQKFQVDIFLQEMFKMSSIIFHKNLLEQDVHMIGVFIHDYKYVKILAVDYIAMLIN